MKRIIGVFLCVCLLTTLTACSGERENQPASVSALRQPEDQAEIQTDTQENSQTEEAGEGRTLIAYFTWADNTVIQDEEAALASALAHYESVGDSASSDVDATTSASLFVPGNAARIAQWIQERTGGDLFSIQVEEPYPDNYDDCLTRAADEKAENARPALAASVENMEQYDTVFLGFPNWWYTCPMALFSFIEEHDLSGKNIVLFCTHGTGGLAASVEDIMEALPGDCTVVDSVLGVYRAEVMDAKDDVEAWIEEIGY